MVEVLLWAVAVACGVLVLGGLLTCGLCEWINSMLEDSEE
jgi:hypothetical protein